MFTVTKQGFHGGDVQGYLINTLPKEATRITEKSKKILAHGETSGHCHILTGDVELFELNGQVFAVVGSGGAFHQHIKETDVTDNVFTINRNISNCDHTKDCQIAPGVYAIGLDRQYDPHQEVWEKNPD